MIFNFSIIKWLIATISVFNNPSSYAALVKCLEFCVTDYQHHAYDADWDNWQLRDIVEQGCLNILSQLTDRYGIVGLLKSRFIERWLSKEPWGKEELERQKNFEDSTEKNFQISKITSQLFHHYPAIAQLQKVGLVHTPPLLEPVTEIQQNEEGSREDQQVVDVPTTVPEDLEEMARAYARFQATRRTQLGTEDDHLRRRHREAMVLNDGTRPLGRGDIFQRER